MKILLAIDDSKYSEAAIRQVIAQTSPRDTEIRLLHVIESIPIYSDGPSLDPEDYTAVEQAQRKGAEALMARAAQTLRAAGFQATTEIADGSPRAVVTDYATKWPADLIVVGSHGRKGLEHLLMGSVSEAVARHAPCSVEIVRIARAAK